MPQQEIDTDRALSVVLAASSAYVRLHAPVPTESWERAELWQQLDAMAEVVGAAVSVECHHGDEGVDRVEVFAVTNGLGLRWDLRPTDWRDGPHNPYLESAVEVHARDGKPVGQRLLTTLGVGRIQRELSAALGDPAAAAVLGERWGAIETRRPGRRSVSDLRYAKRVLEYVRALEVEPLTPIRYMVEMAKRRGEHLTPDQIRAELRRARDPRRDLLTASEKGKAGGEMTAKCRSVLSAVGLLDEGDN